MIEPVCLSVCLAALTLMSASARGPQHPSGDYTVRSHPYIVCHSEKDTDREKEYRDQLWMVGLAMFLYIFCPYVIAIVVSFRVQNLVNFKRKNGRNLEGGCEECALGSSPHMVTQSKVICVCLSVCLAVRVGRYLQGGLQICRGTYMCDEFIRLAWLLAPHRPHANVRVCVRVRASTAMEWFGGVRRKHPKHTQTHISRPTHLTNMMMATHALVCVNMDVCPPCHTRVHLDGERQ